MKIWCDKCYGTGVEKYLQPVASTQYTGVFNRVKAGRKCEDCNGKGYTESEPPKAERINPSAIEMIEAEISEIKEAQAEQSEVYGCKKAHCMGYDLLLNALISQRSRW